MGREWRRLRECGLGLGDWEQRMKLEAEHGGAARMVRILEQARWQLLLAPTLVRKLAAWVCQGWRGR